VGVKWLEAAPGDGNHASTSSNADVNIGARQFVATTYEVAVSAASASEQSVPLKKYDNALHVQFTETPNHGADPRRAFVPQVGFTLISSTLAPAPPGGTQAEYRLQKIRDIDPADAGGTPCGFGSP